eukprot:7217698-Alexandrium_andersonii.AAC.1
MAGFSRSKSKGSRGLRIGGLWIGACETAISRPQTPSRPAFVGGSGLSAQKSAERTPPELGGPISRPCLGPRSS